MDNGSNQRTWSPYQQRIFTDFEDDSGNTVVEAVAGSGKTTTVVEGTQHIPRNRKVLMCAFNKSIQKELEKRVHRSIDVRTLHSLGLLACRRAFGDVDIEESKGKDIAERVCIEGGNYFEKMRNGEKHKIALGAAKVAKLAGLAKNTLTDENDAKGLADLAVHFRLDDDAKTITPEKLVEYASETMRISADQKNVLDFDDMVWFPARHGLRPASHDVVVVDETQDLNAAQLYLAKALCRKKGRIVAVGDRHQAIYAFRGADSEAMPRMIRELEARTLPLSISYRCPRNVVRLAQEVVPHFEAAPSAEDGTVEQGLDVAHLYRDGQPGQMVLSRKKAPLMSMCLHFLARGIPACVAGRDIGKALITRMEKAKTDNVVDMNFAVEEWRKKEVQRLRDLGKDELCEEINDQAAAIFALSEGEDSVASVVEKARRMFRDDDSQTRIVFSTVHKAKGLERDVVWMLGETFRLWSGEGYQEERNLYYVAVTRARKNLRIIGEVAR